MGTVTAKQLKQRTGEIIKRVRTGESITVTYREKPVAIIQPVVEWQKKGPEGIGLFSEAWKSIEKSIEETEPEFKDWQEAENWIRGRR